MPTSASTRFVRTTQDKGWKSKNLGTRNQKQDIRCTRKNTAIITLIIFDIPAFIWMSFMQPLMVGLFLKSLSILKRRRILSSLYNLGNLASLRSFYTCALDDASATPSFLAGSKS